MNTTTDDFQAEVGIWGDTTFPQSTVETIIAHLREEVSELGIADPAEAADCFLLLLHYAHKSGFSLIEVGRNKLAVNRTRTWNTTPEPSGHFKHVEMTANDLRHDTPDPDPPTPAERYESERANIDDWSALECLNALRDMIASLDAEVGRQSVAINRLERGQR